MFIGCYNSNLLSRVFEDKPRFQHRESRGQALIHVSDSKGIGTTYKVLQWAVMFLTWCYYWWLLMWPLEQKLTTNQVVWKNILGVQTFNLMWIQIIFHVQILVWKKWQAVQAMVLKFVDKSRTVLHWLTISARRMQEQQNGYKIPSKFNLTREIIKKI